MTLSTTMVDPHGAAPSCEACGHATAGWAVGGGCVLWRCPQCEHLMRDLDRCRAHAREHAWGGDEGFDRVRTWLTMRNLQDLLPSGRRLDVLEIGFGRGLLLQRFLDRGDSVSGVDPGMLEREIPESLRRRATLYASTAESAEFPPDAFDLVYGIHVVEHLEDPAAVFRACLRGLRPGGLLYLVTPDAASRGLTLFRDAWWNLEDPTHVRFFSRRSITTSLRAAGFEDVRTRTPRADSITLEIGSALRAIGWESDEHGILGSRLALPMYAALLPVAVAARLLWPALAPSMEVAARRPVAAHDRSALPGSHRITRA